MNRKHSLILSLLITFLIASTFYALALLEKNYSQELILRVIDGDTLELGNGKIVRLVNINTPEKGQPGYEMAKNFLKELENYTIGIEYLGFDKYKRNLARIYAPEYVNLLIVQEGFSSKFLVNKEEKSDFNEAERNAIEKEKGIWKKSEYYGCFSAHINKKEEAVVISNTCSSIKMKGWKIKDESRKIYSFTNISLGSITLHSGKGSDNNTDIFWNMKDDVWNNDADTLYLFDAQGRISLYESYGY